MQTLGRLCFSLLLFFVVVSDAFAENENIFRKAIDYAQQRCVKIYGAGVGREHGYASGIVVSSEGHILTAVGPYISGGNIRVVLANGEKYSARVVRRDEGLLAALLQIDAKTPNYFKLSERPVAQQGDWAVAVGNCFKIAEGNEPLSVNLGIVSMRVDLDTKYRAQDLEIQGDVLVLDAITSNPGAPGGALMSVDGRLAGMLGRLSESDETNTRLNYAVPVDLLYAFVHKDDEAPQDTEAATQTDVSANASAQQGKPYLGLRIFSLSGSRAPAYVDRVMPNSPAKKSGLQKDDLILRIGDEVVRNVKEYKKVAEALVPGQAVNFVIKRKTAVKIVSLTPGTKE